MVSSQMRELILVTGGAGYVGSTLCRELLSLNFRVRVIDNLMYGGRSLAGLFNHPNFEFRRGDICNAQDVEACLSPDVEAIVHLAAIVGDVPCQIKPKLAVQVNYEATAMLAERAKRARVRRFLFASTCSNYGVSDTTNPADENRPLNPVSLYAETKVDCEKLLLEMCDEQFQPVLFRFATAYGVSGRPRFDLLINSLTFEALRDGVITVYAANTWRPYVHVADMADIFIRALNASIETVGGQLFNAGSTEQNYVKRDIAKFIEEAIPGLRVTSIDKVDDKRTYRVDFTKLREVLGFQPRRSVQEGIRELIWAIRSGVLTFEDYESNRLQSQV